MLTFILQPYSRVNTENLYPILDLFPIFLVSQKMIPYSRPKLSDFYTLFKSVNSLKTIPFTAVHTYIAQRWEYPPRGQSIPVLVGTTHRKPEYLKMHRTKVGTVINLTIICNLLTRSNGKSSNFTVLESSIIFSMVFTSSLNADEIVQPGIFLLKSSQFVFTWLPRSSILVTLPA